MFEQTEMLEPVQVLTRWSALYKKAVFGDSLFWEESLKEKKKAKCSRVAYHEIDMQMLRDLLELRKY